MHAALAAVVPMILFVLNDPPYGTERSYNALRLALALGKGEPPPDVTIFLMADAVACAHAGQSTPQGFYNVERMLKGVLVRRGRVVLCGTCMDARGIKDTDLVAGAARGTMDELASMTAQAEKVLVF